MKRIIASLFCTLALIGTGILFHVDDAVSQSQFSSNARDPGVRGPLADPAHPVATPLAGLTPNELAFFQAGLEEFLEAEEVDEGVGPTFNLDSCGGCHMQPEIGGSSPVLNPQVAFARKNGATNSIPSFITRNGPVREARFVRNPDGTPDGGVHALFTITGRSDASGCSIRQPDFAAAVANRNVIFRIPTPVFGAGLIEQISDSAIAANQASNSSPKSQLGIRGRTNIVLSGNTVTGSPNKNGNDGTIARFGWKAQNKSLLLFSGEAYNVEMGITSELFQTERDETPGCQFASVPNSVININMESATHLDVISAIEKFAAFMRFLAPPAPSTNSPGGAQSIGRGKSLFNSVGCAFCHTPTLRTGMSTVAALRDMPVNLYSDLLVHDMGDGLADGVSQGGAGPRDFRTTPLWGLGQRIFFLHDGRASNLIDAIHAHQSNGSEANAVVNNYYRLRDSDEQDLLNFLRSL